jgi:hypothetical protein
LGHRERAIGTGEIHDDSSVEAGNGREALNTLGLADTGRATMVRAADLDAEVYAAKESVEGPSDPVAAIGGVGSALIRVSAFASLDRAVVDLVDEEVRGDVVTDGTSPEPTAAARWAAVAVQHRTAHLEATNAAQQTAAAVRQQAAHLCRPRT